MKAVVFHGVGDIRLDEVAEPKLEKPTDAIVRITASAICGTDLHVVRGTTSGVQPGTILGHEAIGVVEQVGSDVRNLGPGDRVVIPSTIACGYCVYCRVGYYSQCDNANPNGPLAGTAYYGGPAETGSFHGLQAEKARTPFASANLVKLPEDVSDEDAIFLSDVFPTGYFGAVLAEIKRGDAVAIFGCGPVGQFAIASAKHLGAGLIFAVDTVPGRLEAARAQGAEVIDFNQENPVEAIRRLTGGIGVDRAIDAVGIDASVPANGPSAEEARKKRKEYDQELHYAAPEAIRNAGWHPGNAPTQALRWAVDCLDKAGTLSIVGVYPESLMVFPIGKALGKNLTIKMGNCNHRKYIPVLIELIRSGTIEPAKLLTQHQPLKGAIDAYHAFDEHQTGWLKVMLEPEKKAA